MAKLDREALVHYIDSTFGETLAGAEWFKIGIDMAELSVNLNSDVESFKNIWGESRVTDNGYEPSMDADPYYANPSESIYPKLKDITMNRRTGAACETRIMEIIVEDDEDEYFDAWVENVIVKPQSYGGDSGLNIPYNVSFNGNRIKGYVSKTSAQSGEPEFVAGAIPAAGRVVKRVKEVNDGE